jgi:hypothetical protein
MGVEGMEYFTADFYQCLLRPAGKLAPAASPRSSAVGEMTPMPPGSITGALYHTPLNKIFRIL